MTGEQLPEQYVVRAITGLPDFRPGDDLVAAICDAAHWIADGDILAVTSKAVSKVEGRLVVTGTDEATRQSTRQDAIDRETAAVVAQRGGVRIVRTRQGPTMAAAGVDASNVHADEIALLPLDSDDSARRIRRGVQERTGRDIAVIITDTVGRPWRAGLVDIALGSAGIPALRDLRGTTDTHGHPLAVTALAQIDELASASELVRGKLGRVAAAVIRGIPWRASDLQPDAAGSLVRTTDEDMFVLGARDVVPAARTAGPAGGAVGADLIIEALARVGDVAGVRVTAHATSVTATSDDEFDLGSFSALLQVALRAEGLAAEIDRSSGAVTITARPAAPYQGMPR